MPVVPRVVLVVDDEADLLFTVTLSLELAGYTVVQAASGEEALAVVEKERPDAVVLDLRLPGIDGWEVLRRLGGGTGRPRVPVVLLSAQVDTATADRAVELGCHAYLAKPFRPAELTRILESVLAGAGDGPA
jgi:two-component system OmpR family response regulator